MKTHPESVWLDGTRIAMAKSLNADFFSVVVSGHKVIDSDLEFVPAAAYIELKNEISIANTQLQTQTENMQALEKERDELRANVTQLEEIRKKLEFAIVCAEDYICHFEMDNDISRQEFLYIRDAAKCLRETDCV